MHRGVKFDIERLTFAGNSGKEVSRECIRHPGSVIILPILQSGEIVLIRNWRLSNESWMWELPAGTMVPGEDPLACAARELEEETGYKSSTLTHLRSFHTAPGLTDEFMHAFIATNLEPTSQHLEVDERITVHPISPAKARQMLDGGEITDAKTLLVLLLAFESKRLIL